MFYTQDTSKCFQRTLELVDNSLGVSLKKPSHIVKKNIPPYNGQSDFQSFGEVMHVKTRFAPSPTGYLHVGGARTALYSWLFAKKHQGTYVLRIEDTDRERSTEEAVQAIFDGLAWLGLREDEGPYFQTKRFSRYQAVIQTWLQEKKAYRCYCTKERLEALREAQIANKEKPRYDGKCRSLVDVIEDKPCVVRFKNPQEGEVVVNDLILGPVAFQNRELDDLIIARSDGTPTYNFTVIVDDYDMQITHVIRGNDHLNNTPRQMNMLKAMGYEPPFYAHLPMLLGEDGKRLSKRHGAVSVLQFRDEGFLPQALLNYLVRLGWAYGDKEIFSIEEMIQLFDLSGVNKAPAFFDVEKLLWLNQYYIKTLPLDVLEKALLWQFNHLGISHEDGPCLRELILLMRDRCKTLKEMVLQSQYFFARNVTYTPEIMQQHLTQEKIPVLELLYNKLTGLTDWTEVYIKQAIVGVGDDLSLKLGAYGPSIRVALTGGTQSPSLELTMKTLGREKTLIRLQAAINEIKTNA